jgi:anti-sigma regulatory factor (Ser/Thr protein kinase)
MTQHPLPGVLADALPPGETATSSEHVVLPPLPEVIGEARRFVIRHAGCVDDETCDVLRLLTSELVTNAVLHARTPLDLGVTTSDRCVLVSVQDEAGEGPSRHTEEREGGRGLLLVEALAEEWAIEHHEPEGKTAWFRLPRTPVLRTAPRS